MHVNVARYNNAISVGVVVRACMYLCTMNHDFTFVGSEKKSFYLNILLPCDVDMIFLFTKLKWSGTSLFNVDRNAL